MGLLSGVRGRTRKKYGPVIVNGASEGFFKWRLTSVGLEIGEWSWNSRSRRHRVDLPGPYSWTSKKQKESDKR